MQKSNCNWLKSIGHDYKSVLLVYHIYHNGHSIIGIDYLLLNGAAHIDRVAEEMREWHK